LVAAPVDRGVVFVACVGRGEEVEVGGRGVIPSTFQFQRQEAVALQAGSRRTGTAMPAGGNPGFVFVLRKDEPAVI
jgi:hypothetical protein